MTPSRFTRREFNPNRSRYPARSFIVTPSYRLFALDARMSRPGPGILFVTIASTFINPEHMQLLFTERIGHMMLGATVIMQTVGYFWIKQVVKIEV